MDNPKDKAVKFLEKHAMVIHTPFSEMLDDFTADMTQGLSGDIKSMLMIPTYMELKESLPFNEPVIVIDAGGTNLRIALVTLLRDGNAEITDFAKYPMPGTTGRISWQQFLDTITDYMVPLLDKSDKVGFCFSFPADILKNKDGRLIAFDKEVNVQDSEGKVIGESLNAVIASRGYSKKHFILLNDTVATMFSSLLNSSGKNYSSYSGLVLGTGLNTCYIEQGENIGKIDDPGINMAVNMESGRWEGAPRGTYDFALDSQTANRGEQLYEKMVSGAYLGSLILLTLKGAAEEGLFSPSASDNLLKLDSLPMWELDSFVSDSSQSGLLLDILPTAEDRALAHHLITAHFERAAKLICVNLAGILVKTGSGTSPELPACIAVEGSSFHKSRIYRTEIMRCIRAELEEKLGLYCELVSHENATLMGTAAAALMNS